MSSGDLPRTWRPRSALLVTRGLGVVLVAVSLGGFFLLPAETRAAVSWPQRLTLLAFLAAALAVMWAVSRGKVIADADGLTVVNMLRTRRLEYAQVVRVRLAPGDPWVQLDLDDGTSLAATGIQAADGERGRRAAAELRELVARMSLPDR